jgi:hypothetical protein
VVAGSRLAVSALCALAGVAGAQPRPDDKAEADRLFEEGRELISKGQRDAACQKFDLSIRKDPRAVGTMLNLGLCREDAGRVATAMALYAEARDRAHDQGLHEHQEAAERKLALLSPRVPHVKIALAAGTPPAVRVLVDELVLAPDQLDDVKIDPGHHALIVTAPGRLPYEGSFDIKESEHHTVPVPELASGTTIVGDNRRATYGKVAMIGGGALVAGGIVLGWVAANQYWDQFPSPSRDGYLASEPGKNCWTAPGTGTDVVRKCNSNGSDALASARRLANVSTGVVIAGGVAAAAGVVLYLLRPTREDAPHVALEIGADHTGLAVAGRF